MAMAMAMIIGKWYKIVLVIFVICGISFTQLFVKLQARTDQVFSHLTIHEGNNINIKDMLLDEEYVTHKDKYFDLCYGSKHPIESDKNTMKYVLSFCLYGKRAVKRYRRKIKMILREAKRSEFYKNWNIRIYNEGIVPDKFINDMLDINPLVQFCDVNNLKHIYPDIQQTNAMTWRFAPIAESNVDIFCSRDLDSPLLKREEVAVGDWLKSNKTLHVMRDNTKHSSKIMGGMWCYRNTNNRTIGKHLLERILAKAQRRSPNQESDVGNDQYILNTILWPVLYDDVMQHDSYLCKWGSGGAIPFPTKRVEGTFVGCKRKCKYKLKPCPEECRPENHKDWIYC